MKTRSAIFALLLALCAPARAGVVMIEFDADWCPSCVAMRPIVAELKAEGYPIQKHIVPQDAPDAVCKKYNVTTIPCFVVVKDGRELGRKVGRCTKEDLRALFPQQQPQTVPTRQGTVVPSVVRVVAVDRGATATRTPMSYGSGTLVHAIDDKALVVTNWHVVKDADPNRIAVVFADGTQSGATVLKTDQLWDLAILAVWKPKQCTLAPLSSADPAMGETLTAGGYGSPQERYRQAAGRVQLRMSPGKGAPEELIELERSAAVRQGDSGGPMFNARGELSGVLFGYGKGTGATGTAISRVRWFLDSVIPKPAGTVEPGPVDEPLPMVPVVNIPDESPQQGAGPQSSTDAQQPEPPSAVKPEPAGMPAPVQNKPAEPAPTIKSTATDVAKAAAEAALPVAVWGLEKWLYVACPPAGIALGIGAWIYKRRKAKRGAAESTATGSAAPAAPSCRFEAPATIPIRTSPEFLDRTANIFVDRPLPELEAEAIREGIRRLVPQYGNRPMPFGVAAEAILATGKQIYDGLRAKGGEKPAWRQEKESS